MKFRIRGWLEKITPAGEEVALGGMYVGTIHGFCLAKVREYWPDDYHNYDILDESARAALILRGFNGLLGLKALRTATEEARGYSYGQYSTLEDFTQAYDQLHEHNRFACKLPRLEPPHSSLVRESVNGASWRNSPRTLATRQRPARVRDFRAARYYAYTRCRRFLDFSTVADRVYSSVTIESQPNSRDIRASKFIWSSMKSRISTRFRRTDRTACRENRENNCSWRPSAIYLWFPRS